MREEEPASRAPTACTANGDAAHGTADPDLSAHDAMQQSQNTTLQVMDVPLAASSLQTHLQQFDLVFKELHVMGGCVCDVSVAQEVASL